MSDEKIGHASDDPSINNVMRHEFKVLSDDEQAAVDKIKDDGLALHSYIHNLGVGHEIDKAKEKVEEAVMWATKGITK